MIVVSMGRPTQVEAKPRTLVVGALARTLVVVAQNV